MTQQASQLRTLGCQQGVDQGRAGKDVGRWGPGEEGSGGGTVRVSYDMTVGG
jgi:hypothetical protein